MSGSAHDSPSGPIAMGSGFEKKSPSQSRRDSTSWMRRFRARMTTEFHSAYVRTTTFGRVRSHTPELAAKVLMNQTFTRAVEKSTSAEETDQLIDEEIVRAASEVIEEMKGVSEALLAQRQDALELRGKVDQLTEELDTERRASQARIAQQEAEIEDERRL